MLDLAISIAGLSFGYERRPVFDEIGIDIPAGRFCALLGPNGAGKSTLFALLTRLVVAKRGRVRIAGFDVRTQGRQAMARIGVVFQQPTLDPALSVRRNLGYYAALRGLAGARARRAAHPGDRPPHRAHRALTNGQCGACRGGGNHPVR